MLLWWISDLTATSSRIGHDRLVATLSERGEAPLLALSTVRRLELTTALGHLAGRVAGQVPVALPVRASTVVTVVDLPHSEAI